MKNLYRPFLILFCSCLLLFTGCGIDNYIFLYPIDQILNNPSGSQDLLTQYFHFRTVDEKNADNDPVNFKGYEIYYRIYNNKSTLNQDISSISTFAGNNAGLIFNWLKETKKYHRLSCVTNPFVIPLIPTSNTNRDVYIRLKDYDNTVLSGVFVGNLQINSPADQAEKLLLLNGTSADFGLPLRTDADGTSIKDNSRYFFDYDEINLEDSDVTYTTSSENEGNWYVQAYVFAYGSDSSYNSIYSSFFSLGYITIKQ
ncbi:MAG TPA: hypothetical protein VJ861_00270 [Treponemataceae bacterium]|nr:hypothetical protein [Treponemataceae bacterium]